MRALRVVGVTGDGSVVLEDPGRRERYTVPADEQLRAAARGDVTRLGQIAIELESQLRPREIQARIRGGASVDEVAAAAGVPTQKIERFAYPVLLERSRTAELAQSAHPQRADGPDSRTLGETVAHTFGLRGQDYGGAGWDSWKGEDGKWVVVLTWQTGRSDNAAHWAFQPGAHGGTVVALDEHASDLVEGLPARPLRPLGAVVDMARDDDHAPHVPTTEAPARAVAGAGGQPEAWAGRGIAPEQRRAAAPARPRVETPARPAVRPDDTRAPAAAAPVTPKVDERAEPVPAPAPAADGTAASAETAAGSTVADDTVADGTPSADGTGADRPPATAATAAPAAAGTTATDDRTGTAHRGAAPGATGHDDTTPAPAPAAAPTSTQATSAPSTTAPETTAAEPSAPATTGAEPAAPAAGTATATTATAVTPSGPADAASDPRTDAAPTPATTAPAAAGPTDTAPRGGAADAASPATDPAAPDAGPTATDPATPDAGPTAPDQDETDAASGEAAAPRRTGTAASRRTKKGKPVMPSWDEVLLGVRGQR
ncbi:septation protein SepH [Pseudonocardia spirodelae]|uniref:Septation protein SepH n=1 Tax=Pseudonocardia spirodelae TaxID=3133431 RepID=A0ABU8TCK0_9PSEU